MNEKPTNAKDAEMTVLKALGNYLAQDSCLTPKDKQESTAAQEHATLLPDGSAFAVVSYPLPKTHWLYAPREYEDGADKPKELPAPILTHAQRDSVIAAIRYAVRGATMCGKEMDFDPDALVQNAVYALCGPYARAEAGPETGHGICETNSAGDTFRMSVVVDRCK